MFDDFIKAGKVRKGTPDIALAKSLIAMSEAHLAFITGITITERNASPVLVNYYEALREICEALCATQGFKVYSHEAFTSYLKERLREELIAEKFDRLRRLRNGVNYYGEQVNAAETNAAAADVKALIATLKGKYLTAPR